MVSSNAARFKNMDVATIKRIQTTRSREHIVMTAAHVDAHASFAVAVECTTSNRNMPLVRVFAALVVVLALSPLSASQIQLRMRFPASSRFVTAHGRRAWAGGYANSGLELWAGALQLASDVHVEFRRSGDVSSIPGTQVFSSMEVDPARLVRTYTGPDFSVDEQVWVPLNATAALIRYTVRSGRPLQVIVRFRPSLDLMWPAALGGQEITWDARHSGYLLTDSGRQFAAMVLVPGATEHDEPLNSARTLPQNDELAVALSPDSPTILFARMDPSAANREKDIALTRQLLQSAAWQQESEKHYQDVLNAHLQIDTPDEELNRTLAWAQVMLDQAWLCNDQLGCAFVGGFGPSRRNRRPQYAWFFAGDGMLDLQAAMAEGDLQRAREEIQFIARYQDPKTGMIWHELSQSAPYLDWRGKYPYMFVHADLTYPYISTVAAYVRQANDRDLLQVLWPSVQKAFEYGKSLIAADGLPRIPEGKQGSDEQDPLTDELGLSASWVAACTDYAHLAGVMGQAQAAQQAQELAQRARASFNQRYWDAGRNFPIQAYGRNGQPVQDRGLGAIDAIPQHLFNDSQTAQVLDAIASWRFQSDWGTRSVAMGEPGFDPTAYAHGSVWGLATAEVAQAYWTAHQPDIAWQVWRTLVPWSTLDSPGHMHEVLAGDTYHAQLESVPEQTWSSASFLSTAVHGIFGLDVDQERGLLTIASHLPTDWDHASLKGVQVGDSKLNFEFQQQSGRLRLRIENEGASLHLSFAPRLPLGAKLENATACGHRAIPRLQAYEADTHAAMDFALPHGSCDVTLQFREALALLMPAPHPSLGQSSTAMKLTSARMKENKLELGLDFVASQENKLQIRSARPIAHATHANVRRLSSDLYEVAVLPSDDSQNYQHVQVIVSLGK
jgi:glycogen debranching enzyme